MLWILDLKMDKAEQLASNLVLFSQPQVNLTQLKSWFDMKMTLHHPPTTTQTQFPQYLSCSWPDFNQTLKVVGLWDKQQQQHEQ